MRACSMAQKLIYLFLLATIISFVIGFAVGFFLHPLWLAIIISFLVGCDVGFVLVTFYWLLDVLVLRRHAVRIVAIEGSHDHGPPLDGATAKCTTTFSPMFWGREEVHPFINGLLLHDLPSMAEVIGRGACGEVYKVDVHVGRLVLPVAVKKITQSSTPVDDSGHIGVDTVEESRIVHFRRRQVHSEIATVGRMRHPNLVRLLAHVQKPECHYLVYDFMRHGSLHDALRRGRLDWPARYKVALGVAAGLEYLHMVHQPRVIHRDLKPANILIDHELNARISDFGLAKVVRGVLGGTSDVAATTTNNVAGTVGYIAPEYYQTLVCTDKCDVYSFGVILAVLVTGRFPTDQYFETTGEPGIVPWMLSVLRSEDPTAAFDGRLAGNRLEEQMLLVLKVACFCTCDDPNGRPNSRDVRSMLSQLGDYMV